MIKDKTILVIGGNSDIAKSVITRFISDGYNAQITCSNVKSLSEATDEIYKSTGVKAKGMILNLDDEKSITAFLHDVTTPDILFIAAGVLPLDENGNCSNELKDANTVIQINYLSIVKILLHFKNSFKQIKNGSVIVLSSVAAIRGRKSNYLYGSSKAGLSQFLSGYRAELWSYNIKVLNVYAGLVNTKLISGRKVNMSFASTPEKTALSIYKAFKKGKSQIYTPGYWYYIMLCVRMMPEKLLRKLKA